MKVMLDGVPKKSSKKILQNYYSSESFIEAESFNEEHVYEEARAFYNPTITTILLHDTLLQISHDMSLHTMAFTLSPVYSDTTQLNSTRRRVELSCVALDTLYDTRRRSPTGVERHAASVLSRSVCCS